MTTPTLPVAVVGAAGYSGAELVTMLAAHPEVSIVGKLAGGIFVYAVSIYDAYRRARIRYEVWRFGRDKA